MLSVVAQQLLTIRQARLAGAPTALFEGRRICVLPNNVCITMNPGYAGRTELPDNLKALGFQPAPAFLGKVVELQQTLRVRFGVMLVGPAAGGKSTVLNTTRDALSSLHAAGSADSSHQKVHTVVFNPKCVSMGELYGEFNELTQEWTDGLASFFIRQAVVDTSDTAAHRWTVFDGPVDALWIENMNTVLDDNMTLCLANAERIKLNQQMRMLFEVQDLAAASPATVSRCGMVYVSDETLGWQPLIASWAAKTLPLFGWDAPATALLKGLFHRHVPGALSFVRLCLPNDL